MKTTRLVTAAVLIGLCGYAWYSTVSTYVDTKKQKTSVEATANDFMERRLYQLAFKNYREACALQGVEDPDPALYKAELDAAKAFYQEEPEEGVELMETAYEDLRTVFPDQPFVWEESIQFQIDRDKVSEAGKLLRKANLQGVRSEKLDVQKQQLYYLYSGIALNYEHIDNMSYDGYYRAHDRSEYSLVSSADGSEVLSLELPYMGPVGEKGMVVCRTEDGEAILYTPDGVKRARFYADFEEAMAVGNGMVPLKRPGNAGWTFFDARGNEVKGGFEAVSMFQNGAAFVKPAGQPWTLMNQQGQLANISFEDVRMAENGSFLKNGVMLVKRDGQWMIADMTGAAVSDFRCDDIDINLGQPIAFRRGEKWGFVKADGTVYIEPCFEEARSFSGAVAAVKQDGLWGYISPSGNVEVDCSFQDAGYFSNDGTCSVKREGDRPWRLIKWVVDR